MPLIATEGESKQRQLPPAGTHTARCYSVIDLGTQESQFGPSHKIRISWELPDEKVVFKDENGEQPFIISKDYTLSLYEKANLRKDLESWRGREFTDEEKNGFDIFTLIGAPCLLAVIHKTANNGKVYANVTSISKLPKGMKVPDQINPKVSFAIEDGPKSETYKQLPQWLQDKISDCQEWNQQQETNGNDQSSADDDEIPF